MDPIDRSLTVIAKRTIFSQLCDFSIAASTDHADAAPQ
jgi:hypothetical protein